MSTEDTLVIDLASVCTTHFNTFSCLIKGFAVFSFFFEGHNNHPAGWLFHMSYFLSLQEAIYNRKEETLTAASWDLPIKGEEEIGAEVIPSKEEGKNPACQTFKEALFGWS